MHKSTLIILFGLLLYSCNTTQKKYCKLSIYNKQIYCGILAPIDIHCKNYKNIELIAEGGKLEKMTDTNYHFTCDLMLEKDSVIDFKIINLDTPEKDIIYQKSVPIFQLPKPYAAIDKKTGGKIEKKYFSGQRGVFVRLDSSFTKRWNITYSINVLSFTLAATINNKEIQLKSNDARFTLEQKQLISSLQHNDSIQIKDIKVQNFDRKIWELEPLLFKIIDSEEQLH